MRPYVKSVIFKVFLKVAGRFAFSGRKAKYQLMDADGGHVGVGRAR